jgi:hypothetical protein
MLGPCTGGMDSNNLNRETGEALTRTMEPRVI